MSLCKRSQLWSVAILMVRHRSEQAGLDLSVLLRVVWVTSRVRETLFASYNIRIQLAVFDFEPFSVFGCVEFATLFISESVAVTYQTCDVPREP